MLTTSAVLCIVPSIFYVLWCTHLQEVPHELMMMAERYEAWRERKDNERGEGRGGGRGGGGRRGGFGGGGFGGGRRDRNASSFI